MIDAPRPSRRPSPFEERDFLEALVFWRGLYASRGRRDSESVISVRAAMASAELLMQLTSHREALVRQWRSADR